LLVLVLVRLCGRCSCSRCEESRCLRVGLKKEYSVLSDYLTKRNRDFITTGFRVRPFFIRRM
jgi:hypothetical protein